MTNLETLRTEMEKAIEERGLIVYHSLPRPADGPTPLLWNSARYTDYKEFLDAAKAAGAKIVTLFGREFTGDLLEHALEQASLAPLPLDERRTIEKTLREMRAFTGFTCQIEMAFDLATRVYLFELSAEWYETLNELLDRIEDACEDDDEDASPLGGYYSKN
jgi:hypothetical protein